MRRLNLTHVLNLAVPTRSVQSGRILQDQDHMLQDPRINAAVHETCSNKMC